MPTQKALNGLQAPIMGSSHYHINQSYPHW